METLKEEEKKKEQDVQEAYLKLIAFDNTGELTKALVKYTTLVKELLVIQFNQTLSSLATDVSDIKKHIEGMLELGLL